MRLDSQSRSPRLESGQAEVSTLVYDVKEGKVTVTYSGYKAITHDRNPETS